MKNYPIHFNIIHIDCSWTAEFETYATNAEKFSWRISNLRAVKKYFIKEMHGCNMKSRNGKFATKVNYRKVLKNNVTYNWQCFTTLSNVFMTGRRMSGVYMHVFLSVKRREIPIKRKILASLWGFPLYDLKTEMRNISKKRKDGCKKHFQSLFENILIYHSPNNY